MDKLHESPISVLYIIMASAFFLPYFEKKKRKKIFLSFFLSVLIMTFDILTSFDFFYFFLFFLSSFGVNYDFRHFTLFR